MIAGVGADGAVTIPERFRGPPTSGNGGYAAGTLAGDGPAEVTLRRPVPLETPMEIARLRDGAAALTDAGEVVLEARARGAEEAAALRAEASAGAEGVTLDAARAAGAATPLVDGHPFPTCFACGPDHPTGLHCLAGPLGDGRWAVTFTPDSDDPRVAWAALDCPSYAPHGLPGVPMVLGRIAAEVLEPLEPGAEHLVMARSTGSEGRRRFSVSAIAGADGRVRAVARATWVVLRD